MKSKFLSISFAVLLISLTAAAKISVPDTSKVVRPGHFYIGTALDGAILSTASIKTGSSSNSGTLRFSWFFNTGVTFNWTLSEHVGIYTGADIKNIGFILKQSGITEKHRTYNIGAPIGIKVGNIRPKEMYGFFGGGLDIPINYKEKYFTQRNHKTKMNEWFSSRTPAVMPYVFAGMAFKRGVTAKLQYYPGNFMNPNFTESNGTQPYAGATVHLILLSIGYAIPVNFFHHDMVEKKINELENK